MNNKKSLIKRFIPYYKPHIRLFLLDIFCALLIAGADLVFPAITRYVLQDIIPKGEMRTLYIIVGSLVILYIFTSMCHYIVNYWGHVVGVRMEFDMRKDLFTHLQTLSFSFYDKTRTGHIMSRMINDLNQIAELAHHGPEDVLLSILLLIGSFTILIGVEWRLAVVIYLFLPFVIWFTISKRKSMSSAFKEVRKKVADVNANLENSISGIRVSKSFTNEQHEMNKFNVENDKFRNSKIEAYKRMAEFMTGINFFSSFLNALILGVGGYLVYIKAMDIADLLVFLLYINLVLVPIRRLSNFAQQFEQAMAGFGRFTEIIDEEPAIKNIDGAIELKDLKDKIRFKDVTFSYNQKETILKNINIDIEKEKTLALVGPSGGGKTTFCHLIPRFYDVDEGEILIDNVNIKNLTIESLRKNIGFVQQDVFIFSGTIRDNILYGNVEATDKEIVDAAVNANIHDFIISLEDGYDTYVGEKGIRLSGGQKQRVSIARVFLKNPPILILDEATSSLDNETEMKIQQALDFLSKGRTTLVIAHRLSTIKNADEILVLTEKGIVERGNHEELISGNGLYSNLYKAQFKGYIPDELFKEDNDDN